MQLISEEYRALNAQKHEQSAAYGNNADKYAHRVRELARTLGAHTILDYGCGKRALERSLGFAIQNYDPAFPATAALPAPADVVCCLDVLEHIEPDYLESVLDHLKEVTLMRGFFTVSTQPAKKHLADGRNAHLIVQPPEWWLPKILQRWELIEFSYNLDNAFYVLVRPRGATV